MVKSRKKIIKKNIEAVDPVKAPSPDWNNYILLGSLVIITFISLSPILKNGFINWDDNAYVFQNASLSKPLPEAIRYFFGPHSFIGNYIPLTMVVYALEYHAVHLKPEFYHLVNILIHLANVLLVFWFIYLLSGKKIRVAGLVALLFGIHPMHVESVAWIAELKDVLYSFFFLAGLIGYYNYSKGKYGNLNSEIHLKPENENALNKKKFSILFILTFSFFALSLLSKPAAVMFPIVLILLDYYMQRKFDKWLWIEKLPFFILSFVFGFIAIRSQQADNLVHDYYSLSQRLLFASHSLLTYIVKMFLPVNLSIFYPYPIVSGGSLPPLFYFSPFIVLLLAYLIYRTSKHSRLVTFGFLFFFANTVLILQLVSVGEAILAERYTYLSYTGLFFVLAMYFDKLFQNSKQQQSKTKAVAILLITVILIYCAYLTFERCKVWKNDDTIATDLLKKFPDDRLALNNKGYILLEQKRFEESITLFKKAIQLKPDYTMASINLINAYQALKDYGNALTVADNALKYTPHDYNLLIQKANILFFGQYYKDASKLFEQAIAIKKDNIDGYISLAQCFYVMKDFNAGIKTTEQALKYEPQNYILLNNKGYFLFLQGKYSEAVEYFKASLHENQDYSVASVNLSDCYRALNDSSAKK